MPNIKFGLISHILLKLINDTKYNKSIRLRKYYSNKYNARQLIHYN